MSSAVSAVSADQLVDGIVRSSKEAENEVIARLAVDRVPGCARGDSVGSTPAAIAGQPFTGKVTPQNDGDMATARIRFEAGAHTYWHVHEHGQLLLAESGRGLMQMQGGKRQDLVPGKPIFAPGGVAHWHGATSNEALTMAAVNFGTIKWLGPVSEKDYAANKR